ncbi:MAG: HlyD family efflux transporter periplasmic adaptor subunit [Nostocaceae cyanobacterium]|nr:HlyD family efflux transporter periplasmic adaptor subunit [Nostocaceae cyanobacterium]
MKESSKSPDRKGAYMPDITSEMESSLDSIQELDSEASSSIFGGTATPVQFAPNTSTDESDDLTANTEDTDAKENSNWSTSLQTVLDQPPSSLPYKMLLGGMLFCSAFVTWASVGQINEVGKASGQLVPQGETYKVHPVTPGKIARILVKEGEAVKAGQVIAELDQEIALNDVARLQEERASYQKQLLQTEALIEKTRLEAQTRVKIAQAEVRGQEAVIEQVKAKMDSQKAAIAQIEDRVATSQMLMKELRTDAAAQQERLERLKSLVTEGALSRDQLFQAQRNLGDRQRTIIQQSGDIKQALTESTRLQSDLQQVMAESQRMQAELARKQAEVSTVNLQAQQTIQRLEVEKIDLQAKLQQTEKLLAQAKTRLKQLTLTAPVDGFVLSLNLSNSGEVVQTGQTIAEIAPQGSPLVLSAILPDREAGFVEVGDSAQVKLDAYPFQDYGIISGKVTSISADAKPNERLGAVYRLEIVLDRNHVRANNQEIKFKAGQAASAEIIIRRRRIIDILLDPVKQLKESGVNL